MESLCYIYENKKFLGKFIELPSICTKKFFTSGRNEFIENTTYQQIF